MLHYIFAFIFLSKHFSILNLVFMKFSVTFADDDHSSMAKTKAHSCGISNGILCRIVQSRGSSPSNQFVSNVGELFFGVFQRGFWDQTLQGSAPFERTPELFCFTMLCTHKILIPIEVTHLYYGVRDMQQ